MALEIFLEFIFGHIIGLGYQVYERGEFGLGGGVGGEVSAGGRSGVEGGGDGIGRGAVDRGLF